MYKLRVERRPLVRELDLAPQGLVHGRRIDLADQLHQVRHRGLRERAAALGRRGLGVADDAGGMQVLGEPACARTRFPRRALRSGNTRGRAPVFVAKPRACIFNCSRAAGGMRFARLSKVRARPRSTRCGLRCAMRDL